jgi:hypothetical protein
VNSLSRSRTACAAALAVTLVLGLASRKVHDLFPVWLGKYPGDALWATAVYFLFLLARPGLSAPRAFASTWLFSLIIELLKLIHTPGMAAIRNSTPGGLIFGHVFTPMNLIAYAIGAALALAADRVLLRGRTDRRGIPAS